MQILSGLRLGIILKRALVEKRSSVPVGYDRSAEFTCTRSTIDNPVCCFHDFSIVFDNHDRVALLGQIEQGIDQLLRVFWVKSDGGLVQHVAHARESRSDTGCQLDSLQFSATEGFRIAKEGQIAEPNIAEILQSRFNLAHDGSRNPLTIPLQFQRVQKLTACIERHIPNVCDRMAFQLDCEGLPSQSPPSAVRTKNLIVADRSEPLASRACSIGAIETKRSRFDLAQIDSAANACMAC